MRRTVNAKSRLKLRGRKAPPFLGHIQFVLGRPVLLYGTIAFVLVFLSLTHIQRAEPLRSRTWEIVSPSFSVIARPFIALSSFVSNISSYQTLRDDYKLLKTENDRLMEWYHTAQLLKAENQSLKSLLNVYALPEQAFITAQVLADPASPYVQSVLLNAGAQEGVKIGQAVIAQNGLLGRIVDVQESLSRVLLLTDINSRVPVMIEGTSQRGVIVGRNLDQTLLSYIPESVTLEQGMSLITSGDGGMLPAGLPVGYISAIEGHHITIALLSDYKTITFVRILEQSESP